MGKGKVLGLVLPVSFFVGLLGLAGFYSRIVFRNAERAGDIWIENPLLNDLYQRGRPMGIVEHPRYDLVKQNWFYNRKICKKSYVTAEGGFDSPYYSIVYCIYEELAREGSEIHRHFFNSVDYNNLSRLDVALVEKVRESFETVRSQILPAVGSREGLSHEQKEVIVYCLRAIVASSLVANRDVKRLFRDSGSGKSLYAWEVVKHARAVAKGEPVYVQETDLMALASELRLKILVYNMLQDGVKVSMIPTFNSRGSGQVRSDFSYTFLLRYANNEYSPIFAHGEPGEQS